MKKLLFPVVMIAVIACMFTSCKKDYTCSCDVKMTGIADTTYTFSLGKQSESDAKSACDGKKSAYTGTGMTVDCHL